MIDLINALLIGFAALISVPAAILSAEILAALLPQKKDDLPKNGRRPSIAILIPAHDEAVVIASTLSALKPKLRESDRLLVVADNCSDDTAEIARGLGAEVVERVDPENCGKGFALDFGIRHLEKNPPEVVIVIDADCLVGEGAIETLARHASAKNRPVQALNLMQTPEEAPAVLRVSALAWAIKNHVRPLGLKRLGLPCNLMGTGMAFPWPVIQSADLASGNIVEDLQLGLDLAGLGFAPIFCPNVRVMGTFPAVAEAAQTQRTRWEHGHLNSILTRTPGLLLKGLRTGNLALVVLTLDMSVPPLGFYGMFLLLAGTVAGLYTFVVGSILPFLLMITALVLVLTSLLVAWSRFGRGILPLSAMGSVAIYLLSKIPIYARFWSARQTKWVRTDRD